MSKNNNDGWAQQKEAWLRTVAAKFHEWRPVAVAIEMADYFNSKSKDAWPKTETIARNLGIDRRGVRRALDQLIKAGLLGRRIGGRGPRDTNRYWMKGGQEQPPQEGRSPPITTKRGARPPRKGGRSAPKRGLVRPPIRRGNLR
jgi:hypothetical protein